MKRMGRVVWRRVGAVLVLVAALAACTPPPDETTTTAPLIANRNLDVLFVVDNSASMRLAQDKLLASFPKFIEVLEGMPGGLPNVHIAVISTDMGAGNGGVTGCSGLGDGGIFQSSARGTCTNTTLTAGARSSPTWAGSATTPATSVRCSRASRRWATRAAASSTSWRRWRARWAPTARRRRRRTPAFCARTRCSQS